MTYHDHAPSLTELQWHVGHIVRRLRLLGRRESQCSVAKASGLSTGADQNLEEHGKITLNQLHRVGSHFATSVSALHTYAEELNNAGGASHAHSG